jgi:hypothetical protein
VKDLKKIFFFFLFINDKKCKTYFGTYKVIIFLFKKENEFIFYNYFIYFNINFGVFFEETKTGFFDYKLCYGEGVEF